MAVYNLPVIGDYAKIIKAVADGIIRVPNYVYVTDLKQLSYIDVNGNVTLIKGDNVRQVTSFPAVGEKDVLYIKDGVVYYYDSTGYHSSLGSLLEDVKQLQSDVNEHTTSIANIQQTLADRAEVITPVLGEIIILNNLTDGIYALSGQYKYYSSDSTVIGTLGHHIFVKENGYILHIASNKIEQIRLVNGSTVINTYLTDADLVDYVTKGYLEENYMSKVEANSIIADIITEQVTTSIANMVATEEQINNIMTSSLLSI